MSSKVIARDTVATYDMFGRTFVVERLAWNDSDGLSFDVFDQATGYLLTMAESFDSEPSSERVAGLLTELLDNYAEIGDRGLDDSRELSPDFAGLAREVLRNHPDQFPGLMLLSLDIENSYEHATVATKATDAIVPAPDGNPHDNGWDWAYVYRYTVPVDAHSVYSYSMQVTASSRPDVIAVGERFEF